MAHVNAQRGSNLGTLITHSAASAGTVNSPVFPTHQGLGLLIFINVTSVTGSITVTLKGLIDEAGTNSYSILASAAIAAPGLTVLRVYPGLTAAANATANDVVPGYCQITSVIATGPCTATISAYNLTAG